MKKLFVFIGVILALFAISGCKTAKKEKLYIYNWTYYIPDEVIKDFQEKYGVEVVYDVFASNEEMYAKLKAGGTGYDITFPSVDYVSIMIKEGMLAKLDKSKLPNIANIDPEVFSKANYDPNYEYSVPYMMGAAGITVNKKYVKDYKKDVSVFLKPELKGRITLLDDMREVLGLALKYQGYSVNTVNEEELKKAKELVIKWKDNIQKFDAEAFGKGFAAGEFWCVHGYQENVFSELDDSQKQDADFFIPEQGAAMYIDSMVILKDAKNKELAHKFINFIHEPEVYAKFVDFFAFPSINVPARSIRKVTPRYDLPDLKNCEIKLDLGENIELYNKVWQEIRVGN
ncbi:MAG: spermidine/putrescine ABC transporter substrate-binding protein [Spirochaetes bacterium GWD1_27_9]|nr:MAG: spermidine/putrescine ABC transporter substrate-binding protein [Spirochaetes bacterium GWB1_27_13]OHD24455.1 MAG: spermidine/putrescine ABC transporter substrate-binding protein [Spirochaetes bacterium GWC1_27_15]OHD30226.1 MAG: spermidine/putrescine ABC transporter substrate-binding protein [Spirochaetes bacterium GWD1_27_9]